MKNMAIYGTFVSAVGLTITGSALLRCRPLLGIMEMVIGTAIIVWYEVANNTKRKEK